MKDHRLECGCGELALTASGPPESVYLCACSECRRASGSAFAWRAMFARTAIDFIGQPRVWRRLGDAGRWVEQAFCERCGTGLYMAAEAIPDYVAVSVPCYADEPPSPQALYRGSGLPDWCSLMLGHDAMHHQTGSAPKAEQAA